MVTREVVGRSFLKYRAQSPHRQPHTDFEAAMASLGLSFQAGCSISSQLYGYGSHEDEIYDSDVSSKAKPELDNETAENELENSGPPVNESVDEDTQSTELLKLVNDDLDHNKQAWCNIHVSNGTDGLAKGVMKKEIKEKFKDRKV